MTTLGSGHGRFVLIVNVLLSLGLMTLARTGPAHDKVVVCYISTWAVYRPGRGSYSIDHFDPNLCTHAIYSFAGLDLQNAAIKSLDAWQDLTENYGKGGYEKLTGLKKEYPHLKVSLAIGGWNEGSTNYSTLVANPMLRSKFVSQVTEFIRRYGFDGLDLDWEYPTQRGGRPHDRENFVHLARELREEFKKHGLMLTSAIGAAKDVIDNAYNILELMQYLDYFHIMTYDYHGSWEKKVGFNAPLSSHDINDVLTIESTINHLIKKGASPNKLVLGLPFYGRTFKTSAIGNIGDASDDKGFAGPFTRQDGFLGYNEICALLSNGTSDWRIMWDGKAAQAIAQAQRTNADGTYGVITFDNSRSIANKIVYALRKNLAGVMIWSVDTDDFRGDCDLDTDTYDDYHIGAVPVRPNKTYRLLRTIDEAMILAIDEIDFRQLPDIDIADNEIARNTINDAATEGANKAINFHPLPMWTMLASSTFALVAVRALIGRSRNSFVDSF